MEEEGELESGVIGNLGGSEEEDCVLENVVTGGLGGSEDDDCGLENVVTGGLGSSVATRILTISNRASEAITMGHAARPISAVKGANDLLRLTSKMIRSRSMSLSSMKDSLAISTACWDASSRSAKKGN